MSHDAATAVALPFIIMLLFYGLGCMFFVAAMAFWIWMIVDVATKEPPGNDKIVWLLIVILLHWIGALVYFFARRRKRGDMRFFSPPSPRGPGP